MMASLHPSASFSRRDSWKALAGLLTLIEGPLPLLPAAAVLTDTCPAPGLFGPNSVTWRIAREPLLLLGGSRALLMQVAHPLVAQGVADHSSYATQPYGRLLGTVRWLVLVTFGTPAEAQAAVAHVQQVHARVRGALDAGNSGDRFAAGTPYAATDATLARWVHATIVQSLLTTYEAVIGPLSRTQSDRFVREWAAVGALMGVDPEALWPDAAALHAYVAREIEAGIVAPVPASQRIADTVLHPPLPSAMLQPLAEFLAFFATGLMPAALRRGYDLPWSSRHQRRYNEVCGLVRAAHPYLPRRLRVSPLYDLALRRACGNPA